MHRQQRPTRLQEQAAAARQGSFLWFAFGCSLMGLAVVSNLSSFWSGDGSVPIFGNILVVCGWFVALLRAIVLMQDSRRFIRQESLDSL